MANRIMGKTGVEVFPLGLGVMRMPTIEGQQYEDGTGKVDVPLAIELIRHAIDNGVNYVDTAYNYHSGHSEEFLGEALKDGYREKVSLASKSPAWLYKEPEDFDRFLDIQMKRLGVDCIDFYMLHSLNGGSWRRTNKIGAIESLLRAKADGRVRHVGFSFHDDLDLFKEILDAAPWDFCQIQLNYRDVDFQAGLEGAHLAAQRGMAVIAMEPLRGGALVNPPQNVKDVFDSAPRDLAKPYEEWAFDFLYNNPDVSLVLSGMNSKAMLDENIDIARRSEPNMLSETEEKVLADAKAVFEGSKAVPCTGCNYCVEYCPSKVVIPYVFNAYNLKEIEDLQAARHFYQEEIGGYGRDASFCTSCGSCEEHCPQHIRISELMPAIDEELGK